MANEWVVTAGLSLQVADGSGNRQYRSAPSQFLSDLEDMRGPTPGHLLVAVTGTDVSLTQLATPGFCRIQNLDTTNYVTVGIYDGASYFPLMEVGPEEFYVVKLYRFLGSEFVGTGTPADVNTLRLMANTAACKVLVEAFNR